MSLRPIKEAKVSKLPVSELVCAPCFAHIHSNCTKGTCNCNCRMFQRAEVL